MGFKSKKKKLRNVVAPLEVVSSEPLMKKDAPKDPTILPNTFKFAAESLKIMSERGGSAGSIVVGRYKKFNYKLIYALVMNAAKNIKLIKKLMHNLKLMSSLPVDDPFLVEILIGDLLYGQGLKSVEKNPIAVAIRDRKVAILKERDTLKKEMKGECESEIPKYLRVNQLKSDLDHVVSTLKAQDLTQLEYSKDKIKFKKFINKYKTMTDDQFMFDFHFPKDLIVIKPNASSKLMKTDLFKKNKATYQDKASFMAVEALDPKPLQNIIDACFAPGCKTSLIATRMRNKGKILAYDIDKKRFISALRFLKVQGATCVQTENSDFSKVKLRRLLKIHKVEFFDSMIIDPSCSGSGICSRVDYKKTAEEVGRLKKLQAFQVSLLKHALRACISKTIVYCTCSTSVEENEQVVKMALDESGVKEKWEVVDCLPYWPERGNSNFDFGDKCLRSNSNYLTNGFFIVKLQCNELFVPKNDDDNEETSRKAKRLRIDRNNGAKEEDDSGVTDDDASSVDEDANDQDEHSCEDIIDEQADEAQDDNEDEEDTDD